jgi:predicted nucleotidyltransferase
MTVRRGKHADPIDPAVRAFLIAEAFRFIDAIRSMPGIEKVALVGSLATDKPDPKDADLLVTVADDLDLTALAAESRRLKGRTQTKNRGADIFLANPAGKYIGRICHWRECAPGIRLACNAQHCGERTYLHDDLDAVRLSSQLVANPPIQIWPRVEYGGKVPADLMPFLSKLQSGALSS